MGSEQSRLSPRIGLGHPPCALSNPLRLSISFVGDTRGSDEDYLVVAASAGVAGVFASAGVRSRGPVLAPIDMNIIPCS